MSATESFIFYGAQVAMNALSTFAEITKITFSGEKLDTDDATHMQSPNRRKEFIGLLFDAGEVTLDLNFIPNSGGRARVSDQFNSAEVATWTITLPEGLGSIHFAALITQFRKLDGPVDKKATEAVTLKITGPITEDFGC